ncbi:MAG: DMT family transporter [Oscillospiraceae bacterium]|nr:DMT family transporter [Oscillospiraceae bacterium]
MIRNPSGAMLVFIGAVLWSLNAPLVIFLDLDPFLKCGLRALIAALTLAPFIRPRKLKWNGWLLLYVVSFCLLSLSIILALGMTSSPVAIGMQYTAIIWLFLVNWIVTRCFDKTGVLPVCLVSLGVVFFMCSGTDGASLIGNLIALTEGITFACMTVSSKKAGQDNPLGLTALGSLFTAAVLLPLFPASTATMADMTGTEWFVMIILGVVQFGGGYAFYNLGVQRATPQKASILALWEMILGPVWVALFLHDYPTPAVVVGFVIILLGMFLDAKLSSSPAKAKT